MRQRLGLATALLGDPQVLILDEPTNGLDPQGVRWLRQLLRDLASQGRTVLFSSHALGEVAQTVDDLAIIASGRTVYTGPLDGLANRTTSSVRVGTPNPGRLERVARLNGWPLVQREKDQLEFSGVEPASIGRAARLADVEIHELVRHCRTLEDVFMDLVKPSPGPHGRNTFPLDGAAGPVAEEGGRQ
jgi:ABC-2 type transport system ATP-binding protein